ncbi:MAG TPA: hypothetical protein PK781_05020 [Terrimesophilobacter sp.]|nr:hypothetical protein [Terrimesophilobacter sp.]
MEFSVGLDTIATLLTVVAGVVGLGATVLASNGRTRTELKNDIAELRTEVRSDISRLDDRVYALAAGLAPRLVPGDDDQRP